MRIPTRFVVFLTIVLLVLIFWQDILAIARILLVILVLPLILLIILSFVPGMGWVSRSLLFWFSFWSFRLASIFVGALLSALGLRGSYGGGRRYQTFREQRSVLPIKRESKPTFSRILPFYRDKAGLSWLAEGGLLIVGRYEGISRALVADLTSSGRRVLIIGRIALVPEGIRSEELRVIWLKKVRYNLLKLPDDRLERRKTAEELAVALAVAEGLDAVEVGMVSRFVDLLTRSGAPAEEDLERLRTEYSGLAARLKDPVAVLMDYFGYPNLELKELLEGNWKVAVIDSHGLADSLALLNLAYLAQVVGEVVPGAVVVIEDAENVLPDINVLPYDARAVWLKLYGRLEKLALQNSLVMLTSKPNFSPQLLDLVKTFVLVEPPVNVLALFRSRLGLEVQSLPHGPVAVTRSDATWSVTPLEVPSVDPVPVPVVRVARRVLEESVRSRVSEHYRGTVLFTDFADLAEEAYRVLRAVKHMRLDVEGAAREAGSTVKIVRELMEKGYISERDGRLILTQLGEEAFADFAKKTGRLRAEKVREQAEAPAQEAQEVKVPEAPSPSGFQVGLGAYLSPPTLSPAELGDVYRMLSDAKAASARQDHILACRISYKALMSLLKLIAGVEKGRPKELAKMASARGVKVAEEEAARAVSIISRISNISKRLEAGEQLSNEDRVWLESSSQFLIELVERILLTLENIGTGEEGMEEGGEELGPDSEGSNSGGDDGDAETW